MWKASLKFILKGVLLFGLTLLNGCGDSDGTSSKQEYTVPPLKKRVLGGWQLIEASTQKGEDRQSQPENSPSFLLINRDNKWLLLDKKGISIKGNYAWNNDTLVFSANKTRETSEILEKMIARPIFDRKKNQMHLRGRMETSRGAFYFDGLYEKRSKQDYQESVKSLQP